MTLLKLDPFLEELLITDSRLQIKNGNHWKTLAKARNYFRLNLKVERLRHYRADSNVYPDTRFYNPIYGDLNESLEKMKTVLLKEKFQPPLIARCVDLFKPKNSGAIFEKAETVLELLRQPRECYLLIFINEEELKKVYAEFKNDYYLDTHFANLRRFSYEKLKETNLIRYKTHKFIWESMNKAESDFYSFFPREFCLADYYDECPDGDDWCIFIHKSDDPNFIEEIT